MWHGRPLLVVFILLGALPLPRSALSVLHADPPARRTDLYGDPLPPGAVARLGTVRFRVNGPVRGVALSPDGKTAAALGVEMGTNWRWNTLHLWEAATGRLLHRCQVPAPSGCAVAFSADGSLLATVAGDRSVSLWDVATGKEVRRCTTYRPERFFYVCFSPQGKRLAAAGSHVVCTWDQESGERLSCSEPEEEQLGVAFSPDGKGLARAEVGRAALSWQVAGERLRTDALTCLAISPDGKTVASADIDGVVWLWEAATAKPIRQDKRAEAAIRALAFSADGKVLAVPNGARIDLYEGGKKVATCGGHSQEVTGLCFSRDGKRLLSGSEDGTVRLWEAQSGKPLGPGEGHGGDVRTLAFHPDGRTLASGGIDGTVRLWDVSGRPLCERGEYGGFITALSFAPDGKRLVLTGGNAGEVRVWEVTRERKMRPVWMHACMGTDAAFSPDGETVAAGTAGPAGEIQLWDAQSGKERQHWRAHPRGCSGLSYAPDGKTLASVGADNTLRFWELASGRQLQAHPLVGHTLFHRIHCCPDGRGWACMGEPPFIDLWDEAGAKRLRRFSGGLAFTFSPDGRLLATAKQGRLKLVEVATGKEVLDWPGHGEMDVWAVGFGPDGKRLVSAGGDSTLLLWDVDLLLHGGRPTPAAPTDAELPSLWRALASTDAAQAYQAIGVLAAAPARAVPFLRQRLRPVKRDRQRTEQLLAELDSDSYAVRNSAYQQLEALGEAAETELRQALAAHPNLEVRLRVERLLALATSQLRPLRALAALERAGTPEARQLLQQLAAGAEGARLTRGAQSALRRLEKRAPTRVSE